MTNDTQKTPEEKKAPALIAYHVPDRESASWTRIGAAWDHKDGKGFTLQLDLVPVSKGPYLAAGGFKRNSRAPE